MSTCMYSSQGEFVCTIDQCINCTAERDPNQPKRYKNLCCNCKKNNGQYRATKSCITCNGTPYNMSGSAAGNLNCKL